MLETIINSWSWSPKKWFEYKKKRVWYDIRHVLSYGAFLNMIVGMRDSGKTYAFKVKVLDRFLEFGEQFIWLRRSVKEKDETLEDFFSHMKNDEYLVNKYGELKFTRKGDRIMVNGQKAGRVLALVQAQDIKSSENPEVDIIVFDEFISESNRKDAYLHDEVNKFLGMIMTIKRHKPNLKVYMLGNSVKFNNPYFIYYKIKPFQQGIQFFKKKRLLVQMYYNKFMAKKIIDSDFGKLIDGTDFYNFAILNQFIDGNKRFIEVKPKRIEEFVCSIKYDGMTFSFYIDKEKDIMYSIRNGCKDKRVLYTLSEQDHDINYRYVKNIRNTRFQKVVNYYMLGRLRFNNIEVREQVRLVMTLM